MSWNVQQMIKNCPKFVGDHCASCLKEIPKDLERYKRRGNYCPECNAECTKQAKFNLRNGKYMGDTMDKEQKAYEVYDKKMRSGGLLKGLDATRIAFGKVKLDNYSDAPSWKHKQ